jgi:alpha-glucosidase (family GH31 glycosyl hydrolase)
MFFIPNRYFTWDNKKFPDPVKMQKDLAAKGRKVALRFF